MGEQCEGCRFWRRDQAEEWGSDDKIHRFDDPTVKTGRCRRYPTHVAKPAASWCGEYRALDASLSTEWNEG